VLIWWLSQDECEAIGEELPKTFPAYMRNEYASRLGRNGRGRLWVDKQFHVAEVKPWPSTSMGKFLGEKCGGIVIQDVDKKHLAKLPGIVTDLKLRRA
jgi:hypothetical protein